MTEMMYGHEPLLPRVLTAEPMPDRKLLLRFTNGEERIFDAKPLLRYSAFRPLQDESFFRSVRVAYGTICWDGDIDYCPDTLYRQSRPIG